MEVCKTGLGQSCVGRGPTDCEASTILPRSGTYHRTGNTETRVTLSAENTNPRHLNTEIISLQVLPEHRSACHVVWWTDATKVQYRRTQVC